MTTSQAGYLLEQGGTAWPPTGRPVVYGTRGVISSGHYLTSMAGMRMLVDGGNAFDGVVAAGFAAAVVEPIASYSLGAEAVFMLYDAASGDLLSLSGQGVAPGRATVDFYRSQGLDTIPTGPGAQAHLSFTVPGVVHALVSMLDRYGTKSLGQVLAPAIEYALSGIPHYEYMIDRLDAAATRGQFDLYPPGGREIFYDDGQLPRPGSILVQKALGETLQRMAMAEADASGDRASGLRAGLDAFYRGETARTLVEAAQRVGGILSLEDLDGYESKFEEPVSTTFMGHQIYGQSTWTQGPVLMQTLNILEGFDLRAMGHNTPAYIHTVTEAVKLAFADRQAYYGDPDFADVPIDALLSKEYGALRVARIDPAKAYPELPPAGVLPGFEAGGGGMAAAGAAAGAGGHGSGNDDGTTHIAVLDAQGNMACATPSGGSFAGSVFFPEVGCTLSTRIEMFNFDEGHPNALSPGKRPRTTLVNYIVSRNGTPTYTIGCPGGDAQAQANVQLILNTLVFGMNPQEAVEAPRFASHSVTNSFHPHVYYPGRLAVEDGVAQETVEALTALGHEVVRDATCGMGATVARRDPDTGVLSTGGDPRRACYAIAL